MINAPTFLDKIADKILTEFKDNLTNLQIVLPNKRAKVFLLNILKNKTKNTLFAPSIISIEELIQQISGIRSVDAVEIIFEFYEVYLQLTPKEEQQTFDAFSNWAKTAIQDFNEIDRYLIEPNSVFLYLSEIKALERWKLEPKDKTELIDKHLEFWHKLPEYYQNLYNHLISKKIGYQGLIYREAVNKLKEYSSQNKNTITLFAGFNALNSAEEKIITYFTANNSASVYWDIDSFFLQNTHHDVGLFIRRFKSNWKIYNTKPFEWATNDFQQPKNIEIIGTPKSVGQAKIAGNIIEKLIAKGETINETALVLGDENLLLPVLNALPNSVSNLNITMGYPSKNNPAQLLISALLKMHTTAISRSKSKYVFYYKDVVSVLNHPLLESYGNLQNVVQKIRNENFTFFGYDILKNLKESQTNTDNYLFNLLFEPWTNDILLILHRLKDVLAYIKTKLDTSSQEESISLTFVYAVYKNLNQIINFQEKYNAIQSVEALNLLYKQLTDLADVSFEGEPLSGLQIMGVLESRVLDFKNVIITSVNEGKFPSGRSQNSFIPYDIKRELGLPTYKEKDAIYSYHFYHLLFRAENIFLLYNTDSEGIDAGERSRFLQQLEIENLPQHNLEKITYNANLPEKAYEKIAIPKTEILLNRLQEIANDNGFSPSSLTSYLRNPIQFYFQRVLRINEADEVEENIALNTLGTIIHDALEQLYKPYINSVLTTEIITQLISKVDDEVTIQFKKVYKEGHIKNGRNYLAFEVAKRNIFNFLQYEKKCIEEGDSIEIIALESKLHCWIENEELPYKIKIGGKVDRIEKRNGIIRIIDYKSGKVEANNLKIKAFDKLVTDIKYEKIIQLLCYALMYQSEFDGLPTNGIEAGIISFKNLKSGFMPFKFNDDELINDAILANFTTEITTLIQEILNPKIDFTEKTI